MAIGIKYEKAYKRLQNGSYSNVKRKKKCTSRINLMAVFKMEMAMTEKHQVVVYCTYFSHFVLLKQPFYRHASIWIAPCFLSVVKLISVRRHIISTICTCFSDLLLIHFSAEEYRSNLRTDHNG